MIRRLVAVGVDQPVLLNLVFAVVVLAGVVAWIQMPKEEFPQVGTDRIVVSAGWPGASPEEVEDAILRPLEDAVDGVGGVLHAFGEATVGRATLQLDLVRGSDVDAIEDEVRRAVADADGLPDDVIGPAVTVAEVELALIHVALTGDPRRIDVADALAAELLELPFVDRVDREGQSDRAVRVTLDPARSAAFGVGPRDVVDALEGAAVGLPAGDLSLDGDGVLVRTARGVHDVADLAGVPLRAGGDVDLRVGDVATVTSAWEEPEMTVRVDGQPAILLIASRSPDADALAAVPVVRAWAAERAATLPPGLGLVAHDDSAYVVADRLQVLASNGAVGIALVALLLGAFVGWRNAGLVVWGMPVAYLGAIAALHAAGQSMNLISLFALLLVTGIIVDDAVVIVENVQRHLEQGKARLQATLDGTVEVFGAVVAATLTTCLAFAPLLMLEGLIGRVMRIVPTVVILSLLASLFEAFVVLPGHLAHFAAPPTGPDHNGPTRWLKAAYRPVLERIVGPRARWVTLAALTVSIAAGLSLALVMRVTLTTPGHPILAIVEVELPPSSTKEATLAVVRDAEAAARDAHPPHLLRFFRAHLGRLGKPDTLPRYGDRYAQLVIGFRNDKALADDTWAFVDALEQRLAARPEVLAVSVDVITGSPPVGKPVDVRVRGRVDEDVVAVAEALRAHLDARPGVDDLRDDLGLGDDALEVQVDPTRAARLGLAEAEIAAATRARLDGADAIDLTVSGRTTQVMVDQAPPAPGEDLADGRLLVPDAPPLRLRQVAQVVRTQGVERVARVDGERAIRLTAEVDPQVTTAVEEQRALQAAFDVVGADHPGVRLLFGGEAADTAESFGKLPYAALLAVALIYAVLAVQFASYLQPLIILSAVPLGLVGVVVGLFTFGMDLTLVAMIGVVGLIGIVVNDSLVLVDFLNQRRREGADVLTAVVQGSLERVRPIFITTVTTVAGLLPLGLGLTGDEPLLAPMAIAIAIGLSFATVLTLVAVPVLYLIVDDVGSAVRRALGIRGGPAH